VRGETVHRHSSLGDDERVPAAAVVFALLAPLAPFRGSPSPSALAQEVSARFASAEPESFAEVFPFPRGRELVASAARDRELRFAGEPRVVRQKGDRAVLLLGGIVQTGNTGDDTILSRGFSGLYEARLAGGRWALAREIPIDEGNRILAHDLQVMVSPKLGLKVRDDMSIRVGAPYGFAVRLNHAASISSVELDGRTAEHVFLGGVLWVRAPRRAASLRVSYSLAVGQTPTSANSGCFLEDAGHVRNQYFWHPFFDFDSAHDRARVDIAVTIAEAFRLSTSLSQTERVEAGRRIVTARSESPVFALTLAYDRLWLPSVQMLEGVRLALFTTPDFAPPASTVAVGFAGAVKLLGGRFGRPRATYFGVVQARARGSSGWHFRSNDVIVAGVNGGDLGRRSPYPRAWFGHEVAHLWTNPIGPATNLLGEGWATFCEALLAREEYGEEAERELWEAQRNAYFARPFDGVRGVLEDPMNGGIAYSKGSWLFAMLERVLGAEAFDAAMRRFAPLPPDRADLDAFLQCFGKTAARFLQPWLKERVVPDLEVSASGPRAVLTQRGPLFWLPRLDVELVLQDGRRVRRMVDVAEKETAVESGDATPVADVSVDPEHRYLLRRHRGETVRLALSAEEAAGATVASLESDLSAEILDVPRAPDGGFAIELPVTEGRYVVVWRLDGKRQQTSTGDPLRRVLVVSPKERLANAYPRP
jgi:hypothetical protein